jgi:hypothetical protein
MGTWERVKLEKLPLHNSLGFFCWERSLKIHRNQVGVAYELVSSAAGRLATAASVELFCQETHPSLFASVELFCQENQLSFCLYILPGCLYRQTALHCILCVYVHGGRHCCHESFFVARVGCMPSWKLENGYVNTNSVLDLVPSSRRQVHISLLFRVL